MKFNTVSITFNDGNIIIYVNVEEIALRMGVLQIEQVDGITRIEMSTIKSMLIN